MSDQKESPPSRRQPSQAEYALEFVIFASRWIQAPLFLGLIVASIMYAVRFMMQLVELYPKMFNPEDTDALLLGVLGLVDMTMVANLIAMIVIGGYTLFVSKLNIGESEDRPEWLDKTTAATLKIKLASALVGVSGIHLLKTFIELGGHGVHAATGLPEGLDSAALEAAVLQMNTEAYWKNINIMWQVVIHTVFLLSSIVLSVSERVLHPPHAGKH